MKTYYSDYLIDMAEPELVHDQFGQKQPIPKNGGKVIDVKQYEAFGMVFGNPITNYVKGKSFPGMAPTADLWGTVTIWPAPTFNRRTA